MKTVLARTSIAAVGFALLALAGCKSGGAATAKYIPESATIVGGVDLAGLQKSKLWTDHIKGLVEAQGKDVLDAMNGCNVGLDKWKSVTFGGTADGGNDKVAVVAVADGLGKKENIECAHGKLKEKAGGTAPWTAEEDGKVLKIENGSVAYVIDDNTVVMAGKDWAADVQKLTKGEGKSAFDGSLKDIVGRTDTGKHVWFAGMLPESVGGMAASQLGATPKDVAGFVDFSSGMETKVSMGVASKDEAEAVKTKIETMFAGLKGMASSQGVSGESLDSVKFGTDGSAVTVEAKASDADLAKAMEQAKGMI
jgi:hypothetical protein